MPRGPSPLQALRPPKAQRRPGNLLRRSAVAALPLVVALPACQRSDPELLSVHRLEPARAAVGDRLAVTGEGFPEGRSATVTFRGDLYRPGVAPERDVRIAVNATQSGRDVIVFPLDGALERRFVGRGPGAVHATFRGDVRVSFDPGVSGVTAISGTSHDVRFDVLPTRSDVSAGEDEPRPTSSEPAAALGMATSAEAQSPGLRVTAVAEDGRAAAAGVRTGDLLLDFDGVTVLSDADLQARSGEQTVPLIVERQGRILPPLVLDVSGLAPLGATDLVGSGGILLAIATILVLLASRPTALLRWAPHAVEAEHGRSTARGAGRALAGAIDAIVHPIADARGLGVAALVVFGLVLAALVRLATGHSLLSADLDLVTATLSVSVALVCARFADGGVGADGQWTLRAALTALLQSLACVVPAILAVGGAILASGRFVIGEMVATQGAAPWRWAAGQNPGLTLLALMLLGSTAVEAGEHGALSAAGLTATSRRAHSVLRVLVRLAEWSYLWVMSALGVLLFLGGWKVSGVSALAQEAGRTPSLVSALGAAVLVVKVGAIVLGVGAGRRALARVHAEHVAPLWAAWAVPGSAFSVALAAGWSTALESARSAPLADLCGYVATLVGAAGAAYLALAMRRGASAAGNIAVNPWL